jgi:hypothetical protein
MTMHRDEIELATKVEEEEDEALEEAEDQWSGHNQLKDKEDDIQVKRIQSHCTIGPIKRGKVCRTHLFRPGGN